MTSHIMTRKNAPGAALNERIVELLESAFAWDESALLYTSELAHIRTVTCIEVVDIGISKGATGDSVTANSNAIPDGVRNTLFPEGGCVRRTWRQDRSC